MTQHNPLASYPRRVNQAFFLSFGVTALMVAWMVFANLGGVVDDLLEVKAWFSQLSVKSLTGLLPVLFFLMIGTGFGRLPLSSAPKVLYALFCGGAAAFFILALFLPDPSGSLAKFKMAHLHDFAYVLALPLPFVIWSYVRMTVPGIYAPAGGLFGLSAGLLMSTTAYLVAGLGMLSSYVVLALHNRRSVRTKVQQSASPDVEGKDGLKRHQAQRARYTFADVDGMSELKQTLLEAAKEATSSKQQPGSRNGILLYGPPGNGKSFIAEALAGELGYPIMHMSFGGLASRWVNQSTEQLVALFADAASSGKVVLFLDEIDAVLINRANVQRADSEEARIVSVFLAEVDKLRRHPVLLIGATNHLDRLDPAAIRPGRFDIKVEMTPPDLDARVGVFERYLRNTKRIGLTDVQREALRKILNRMDGFSVATMRALAEEFARRNQGPDTKIAYASLLACLRAVQGKSASEQERFPALSDLVLPLATAERMQTLISLMKNPVEIEQLGGKVPRGVLLYGPPGTGKTTLAKAIAKESGWTFVQSSGHKLLHDPNEVRSVLDRARDLKPAIIFIDEADDILSERVYSGNAALTNEFLTAMDGNSFGLTDVLFIGATNQPNALDAAAIRGGRLGFHVEVGLPGPDERRRLVEGWFKGKQIDMQAEGFDLDGFVQSNEGVSPADILHEMDEWANRRAARIMQGASIDHAG